MLIKMTIFNLWNLIKLDKFADKHEKLSKNKFTEFRGLVGQLSWAAENTRPDIAFEKLAQRIRKQLMEILRISIKF